MKRRDTLLAAAGLLAAPMLSAQPARVRRVGVLLPSASSEKLLMPLLRKRLAELGWSERRNLSLEPRNCGERYDRLPPLAAELVRLNVDVIIAVSTPAALAAKDATATIPIVFTWISDPVGSGLAASLARPGGNLTGLSNVSGDLVAKQVQLLREIDPKLTRFAGLVDPKFAANESLRVQLREAASRLDVGLVEVAASRAEEFEAALALAARARATALLVPAFPLFGSHRERIASLALRHRIAAAGQAGYYAASGFLLSYGSDFTDGFLRAALHVDKILRGASPADLPVELADRFELVINLKTAKALGLTFPQSILLRADKVIE